MTSHGAALALQSIYTLSSLCYSRLLNKVTSLILRLAQMNQGKWPRPSCSLAHANKPVVLLIGRIGTTLVFPSFAAVCLLSSNRQPRIWHCCKLPTAIPQMPSDKGSAWGPQWKQPEERPLSPARAFSLLGKSSPVEASASLGHCAAPALSPGRGGDR